MNTTSKLPVFATIACLSVAALVLVGEGLFHRFGQRAVSLLDCADVEGFDHARIADFLAWDDLVDDDGTAGGPFLSAIRGNTPLRVNGNESARCNRRSTTWDRVGTRSSPRIEAKHCTRSQSLLTSAATGNR